MRATTRTIIAAGAGLALVLASSTTLPQPTPAAAAAAEELPFTRAPLPAGTTILVTASGDSGPGTLGDAIAQANAAAGPDTIEFADGLDVTVTGSWTVAESLTLKGKGATLRWQPVDPAQGPLLAAAGATVQASDLTLALEAESWDPMIHLSDAPTDYTTVLERVSFRDAFSGALLLEGSGGGVELRSLSATGRAVVGGGEESAVIELWDIDGSVSLTDSAFSELSNTAVALLGATYDDTKQVLAKNNSFERLEVDEAEFDGMALHIEDIASVTSEPRATPAVLITDNVFDGVSGRGDSVVHAGFIEGGVAFHRNELTGSSSYGPNLSVQAVDGEFGPDGLTVALTASTLSGNESEESGLSVEDVEGDVLLSQVTVSGTIAPEAGALLGDVEGGILVSGSTFAGNTAPGLLIDEIFLPNDSRVLVTETVFSGNVLEDDDRGAGLMIVVEADEDRVTPLVEVENASFLENKNGVTAGALIMAEAGHNTAGPNVLVSGSTFWNPRSTEEGTDTVASDLFVEDSTGIAGTGPAVVVRNSTVERRDAIDQLTPAIVLVTAGNETLVEHVSMPGGALALACGDGGSATVQNAAIGADGAPAIDLVDACGFDGRANTLTQLGSLPAAAGDELPTADWQLGPLASNGGSTQTLLPASTSPLLDSAVASDVVSDQRGVSRPQGAGPDRGAVETEHEVPAAGTIEIGPDASVRAGEAATLTVMRSGPTDGPARVAVELRDGSAIAGTDYVARSYQLEWAAGEASAKTISVETLKSSPGSRALTAALVSPTGAELGARATAVVKITQDTPAVTPPESQKPPLPGTGSTGAPVAFAALAGLLAGLGALALTLRARARARARARVRAGSAS